MSYQLYVTELSESLGGVSQTELNGAIRLIQGSIDSENTVWIFGNGGSGATASHGSCDLSKGVFMGTHKKARIISLNDLQYSLSAWINDHGFEQSIANMLKNLARPNDVFMLISGSGSSKNLKPAIDAAREIGLSVITLTGFQGGQVGSAGDYNIVVESDDMQTIENAHLALVHWIFKCIG
jgi:D-sedoheptulose 7-phosphate isomerase